MCGSLADSILFALVHLGTAYCAWRQRNMRQRGAYVAFCVFFASMEALQRIDAFNVRGELPCAYTARQDNIKNAIHKLLIAIIIRRVDTHWLRR